MLNKVSEGFAAQVFHMLPKQTIRMSELRPGAACTRVCSDRYRVYPVISASLGSWVMEGLEFTVAGYHMKKPRTGDGIPSCLAPVCKDSSDVFMEGMPPFCCANVL